MSIKLIISDMDGTLLDENLQITDRAAEAILTAQATGIEFAVATGRTHDFGYSLVKEKGIHSPFIELNGARFFDEKENLQFTRDINKKDLEELIQIIDHYKINNQFITQKGTYSSNSLEEQINAHKEFFQDSNKAMSDETIVEYTMKHLDKHKIHKVEDYGFLIEESDIQLLKVLLNSRTNKNTLSKIEKAVKQNLPDLIVTSANQFNLEINHAQANKGQAVADYAKLRGYQADEIITIGDNINDLTMLEWASHSYAVENAHELAKKTATYSAPHHADDAVAQIIEKVLAGDRLSF